jgi:glycosyltransferase involved in cell wall biosynthesis
VTEEDLSISPPPIHVAVYGDVDLNLIDGSAIWLQAVAQAFRAAGCEVTVLLKAPVRTDRLTAPLESDRGIRLVRPFEEQRLPHLSNALSPFQAETILNALDRERAFDAVVVRGFRLVKQLVAGRAFDGRLWTYLTDVPHSVFDMRREDVEQLQAIALASQFLLCQTEALRSFLEGTVPAASGRAVLFPPIIPDVGPRAPRTAVAGGSLRLVYSGKFALDWKTLEMTRLPSALAGRGVRAQLDMVGDKVHNERRDPGFHDAMTAALQESPGVVWHGGVPRARAMELVDSADVTLGWRSERLDASLELSTKVLESGAQAVPVVLNRTPVHEQLLGIDYPLFVRTEDDVVAVLAEVAERPASYAVASARCLEAAEQFTQSRAIERIRRYLDRAFPSAPVSRGNRKLRVLVASHDLKFFAQILDYLARLRDLEVRVDEWEALAKHDEARSQQLLDWADVVVCEWCGPNAIWYSRRKRPGQRLVVRLHRFELYSQYHRQVVIDAVDEVVCVSPHYQRLTREITRWPAEKIICIPNGVDIEVFDRPKYPGAQFHLGMIGVAPSRKRFDLALDVLEQLRRHDERFMLFAKTKMPWEYWWIWNQGDERAHYRAILERIESSPHLRGAVVFDRFGPDVAAWLQKIGWVLSTSDDESFHLAPAEGMASGALPALLPWSGAETIYDSQWINESPAAISAAVSDVLQEDRYDALIKQAKAEVRRRYALQDVCVAWAATVQGMNTEVTR